MIKYISLFLIASFLVFTSCKKSVSQSVLEKYFNDNVIGKNCTVTLAIDSTGDITSDYTGYIFVLLKTDYYHGPLKATIGSNGYMGTWSSNADYSQLNIALPDSIPEFQFLSRSWRFTKKGNPTMELAPWGTTEPYVLHMTKQ
ncbi:MAG TPA: hypothetical protein VIJ75_05740 [Hanamia sp.]